MGGGLAQPCLRGPVSLGRGVQPGPGRSLAAVLPVFRRDQAQPFQPLHGSVDLAFVHVPGHSHAAVGGQQGREREPVDWFLADPRLRTRNGLDLLRVLSAGGPGSELV